MPKIDNHETFMQYMDTLLSKTAREIYFDMQEIYYEFVNTLDERPVLQFILNDMLVKRNEEFYKNPFEIIDNEVNSYTLKEKKINYLFTQKLHSANKLRELEDSSKIKTNKQNSLANTDFLYAFLVAILKDYKDGYCPKLSSYKREVNGFILEYIKEISAIEDLKKDEEFTAYFSSAKNLAGHCKAKIHINVFALIMEIEIENHCTKLLNELQGNTETPTDKTKPETFEDTENRGVTLNQKILVLKELGFFDLPKYDTIKTQKKRAKLISFLIGKSEENIRKALQIVATDEFAKENENLEKVNSLFETIGLDKIDNVPKKKGHTPRT